MPKLITNASFLVLGKVINAGLSAYAFVVVAGALPIEELGIYSFLIAASALIALLAGWGTNDYLFRRGAAKETKIGQMLRAANLLRVLLAIPLVFVAAGLLALARGSLSMLILVPVATLVMIIDAQTVAHVVANRARRDMGAEVWLYAARGMIRLGFVMAICSLWPSVVTILFGVALANALGLAMASRYAKGKLRPSPRATTRYLVKLGIVSTPFFLAGLLTNTAVLMDPILVGILTSDHDMGVFSVAMQIFTVALMVPMALSVAVQPDTVRLFESDRVRWRKHVQRRLTVAMCGGLVVAALGVTASQPIAQYLLGGKFSEAAPIIQILMAVVGARIYSSVSLFPVFISARLLDAWNRALSISILLHFALSILFIPYYGSMGAASAFLISEILLGILATIKLWSYFRKYEME